MQITYRLLRTADEMEDAVRLQQIYWGEHHENLVPAHMLLSIVNYGGHVIAALDGSEIVGVLIGFLGVDLPDSDASVHAANRLLIMSKRMVVLPAYRGQKIGETLKLMQRDAARKLGIQLVTWTFDPVLSRNAYLNLHKLRAVGQAYKVDYFGSAGGHPSLTADRLVVNWWVNHPSQTQRNEPDRDAPIINTAEREGALFVPAETIELPSDLPQLLLEVLPNFYEIEAESPVLAAAWRDHMRAAFQQTMAAGYIATDMLRRDDRVYYVMTRDDGTYTFIQPEGQ